MSGNRISRTGLAAACATALTLGLVSPATAAVVAEPVKDLSLIHI